jgi:hypothetical protein
LLLLLLVRFELAGKGIISWGALQNATPTGITIIGIITNLFNPLHSSPALSKRTRSKEEKLK